MSARATACSVPWRTSQSWLPGKVTRLPLHREKFTERCSLLQGERVGHMLHAKQPPPGLGDGELVPMDAGGEYKYVFFP